MRAKDEGLSASDGGFPLQTASCTSTDLASLAGFPKTRLRDLIVVSQVFCQAVSEHGNPRE